MTGSDVTGTGSHVFWEGKPLTRGKKGSRAQATGSHVFWDGKTAEERGLKVQSPIGTAGGDPLTRKTSCWKNVLMADMFEQLNSSFNDNPWYADDESSISQEEAEAGSRDLATEEIEEREPKWFLFR